ncbi:glycosyltransferase [Mesobacillus maritimus]|uniref:glycosyltransferase n=1 Tax=Mesobacillus maritimus TaxID=1643336 RepID=UPI00384AD4E1
MKKVLVLVGEHMSANGICADAVMQELKSNGCEVDLITNQEYQVPKFEKNNGIKIKRIKPRLTYRMDSWCTNNKVPMSRILSKISYLLNKAKLFISIPTWPLVSPLYSYRFYKAAKSAYIRNEYDCIISVYTQIDTVIAGYLIKRKYPNVKFVPYFLDSLSGGIGPKIFSRNWTIRRGMKWERRLLKYADKIIMMESSRKHHEVFSKSESYFPRIKFLDIPLLTQKHEVEGTSEILEKDKINLVYVGSLPHHIRNPQYLLEIFKRLRIKDCVLTIIGTSTCNNMLENYQNESKKNKIVIINKIPHEEALKVLKNADVLINIGNNINSMVPSKIFEYMSIGKPIISTYPIEDEPSKKYLKDYPLSLLVKEDWNWIDKNVVKVENFIKDSRNHRVATEDLMVKMYRNTPQSFVEEIKKVFR